MATYQSKFSGVEIDEAVAYYNAIEKSGRTVLTVDINSGTGTGGWTQSGDVADLAYGKYFANITAESVFNVVGANFEIG